MLHRSLYVDENQQAKQKYFPKGQGAIGGLKSIKVSGAVFLMFYLVLPATVIGGGSPIGWGDSPGTLIGVSLESYVFGHSFFSDQSLFSPQIVLENSSREDKHECPFGRSSIELTKMLCEILKVGELREYSCICPVGVELSRPSTSKVEPLLLYQIQSSVTFTSLH